MRTEYLEWHAAIGSWENQSSETDPISQAELENRLPSLFWAFEVRRTLTPALLSSPAAAPLIVILYFANRSE